MTRESWPEDAKFTFGQLVQRRNLRSGKPPAYRFPGMVCGWYVAEDGTMGYPVNSFDIPGCIQIYPEVGLEPLPASVDTLPKGQDSEAGLVRSKGGAVPSDSEGDAQNA